MTREQPLAGKVAVVTGASRGIGKQTAITLGELGALVVIASRTEEPREGTPGTLVDTAHVIRDAGREALVVRADLGQQGDIERLVSIALDARGHVDVLVNNAAYTVGKGLWANVPDVTREQWEKGFAINVTAPLMLIEGFWESMKARGGGIVVNVTSGAAELQPLDEHVHLPGSTLPTNGPLYGTTKAALNRMANVIASEGARYEIAVVNVDPGFVLTEVMEQTLSESGADGAALGAISPEIPARAIAYLCTCENPMQYSGQIVDGPELLASLSQAG
jgi:NAD(P)-dependent dehydrogenase (short-subunit alcohol dehydrogenase family)